MVRITPELVENAPQFTNAIQDRELNLRGYKFPAVENLGSTLDQFDTIDLSDNEIRKLDGFPMLKRLKCVILTNNKIVRLAEDIGQQIPNVNTLILTGNGFSELRELEPLSTFEKLTFLSLLHCPVTMRANYRLFVISRIDSLRFLDYRRVTQSERRLARNMFKRLPALALNLNAKNPPNKSVNGLRTDSQAVKTFVPGAPLFQPSNPPPPGTVAAPSSFIENTESDSQKSSQPHAPTTVEPHMPPPSAPIQTGTKRAPTGGSTQDLFAIQEAIKRAKSMEEVERLHHLLSTGQSAGFAAHWQQQLRLQQQQKQQQLQQQQQQQQQQQDEQHQRPQSEEAQPVESQTMDEVTPDGDVQSTTD